MRRCFAFLVFLLLSALILPLSVIVLPLLILQRKLKQKSLAGWTAKLTGGGPDLPRGATIFHGVSLGEVNLLLTVLPQLKAGIEAEFLEPIALSTSTATGQERLKAETAASKQETTISGWTIWPIDVPWAVIRFFARHKPRALVLAELEIWPMMLLWAQVCQVPVIVMNGRMSAASRQGWGRVQPLAKLLFGGLKGAMAQNEQWAQRLRELGTPQVSVTGSLKADAVQEPKHSLIEQVGKDYKLWPLSADKHQPTFLIASTAALLNEDGGEEDAAITSWLEWGKTTDWRLVIAPRHPERGPAIATKIRSQLSPDDQTPVWLASESNTPPPANAILVLDVIGILTALYAVADIALIGGGWGSGRGSQNMLEAAAAQCPAIVGPDYKNFPDIVPLLKEENAVIQLDDPNLLNETLQDLAQDAAKRQELGKNSFTVWQNNRGSVNNVAKQLPHLLHKEARNKQA